MHNPHLRFTLARDAFFNRDYDTAIAHLKFAIRKHKDEDEYYFLLGMCYLMKGEPDKARRGLPSREGRRDRRKETRLLGKIETLRRASEKAR